MVNLARSGALAYTITTLIFWRKRFRANTSKLNRFWRDFEVTKPCRCETADPCKRCLICFVLGNKPGLPLVFLSFMQVIHKKNYLSLTPFFPLSSSSSSKSSSSSTGAPSYNILKLINNTYGFSQSEYPILVRFIYLDTQWNYRSRNARVSTKTHQDTWISKTFMLISLGEKKLHLTTRTQCILNFPNIQHKTFAVPFIISVQRIKTNLETQLFTEDVCTQAWTLSSL